MRIGIHAQAANAATIADGHTVYWHQLLRALSRLATDAELIFYLSRPPRYPFLRGGNGVRTKVLPLSRCTDNRLTNSKLLAPVLGHTWERISLTIELALHRPDVYFAVAHTAHALRSTGPAVYVVFDLAFISPQFEHFFTPDQRAKLRRNTAIAMKRAHRISALSYATKRDLVEYFHMDPNLVEVVYPGIDTEVFHPIPESESVRQLLRDRDIRSPYLLHVGSYQPRKNLVRLVEAFALALAALAPRHQLVLVGSGGWLNERGRVSESIHKLGLSSDVVMLENVDPSTLPVLYSHAVGLIYPALYEGFGLPALEAMACGTPVIASNGGATAEVVGESGLLVDPTDRESIAARIVQLTNDAGLRRALSLSGMKRAAQFSWEQSASDTMALLARAWHGRDRASDRHS